MPTNRYIKCSHCNQVIAVESEYMILCPNCHKKLDNSFHQWQNSHPMGTFTDYLSEVCVSQQAIQGLGQQRRITRSVGRTRALRRGVMAIALAVIATIIGAAGYFFYNKIQSGRSIRTIVDSGWKINYYPDLEVSLKFPSVLGQVTQVLADSIVVDSTQKILSSAVRQWVKPGVTSVTAMRIDYAPNFGVNRQAATEQILQSLIQENELRGFVFVPSDYSMPGVETRMFTGSYLIKAEAYEFRAVMAIRGDRVWYFMVAYLRSMPEGTLLAEKFFKGILLETT